MRDSVEYAEWLADKLHNGGDFGKEAATLLVEQAKAIEYHRACRLHVAPRWVPARVRLAAQVRGDPPIGHTAVAEAGEHDCDCNKWGAVSVRTSVGQLGLKPAEFDAVAWRKADA